MNEISFKDLKVNYIYKPAIKHSYISIKPDTNGVMIILKTPSKSSLFIHNLLLEKELWIRKKLHKIGNNLPKQINLEDEVLLYGEVYSIDAPEVEPLRVALTRVKTQNTELIEKKYNDFYKNEAKRYLTKRVKDFALLMKLDFKEIKFRKMKSRWGSCSSHRVITLNTQLIKIKKELIDYVIVHELAHLVHMNHSKRFHNLVDRYLPNAKEIRKKLKSIYLEK